MTTPLTSSSSAFPDTRLPGVPTAWFADLGHALVEHPGPALEGLWVLKHPGFNRPPMLLDGLWTDWLDFVAVQLTLAATVDALTHAYRCGRAERRQLLRIGLLRVQPGTGEMARILEHRPTITAQTLPYDWRSRLARHEAAFLRGNNVRSIETVLSEAYDCADACRVRARLGATVPLGAPTPGTPDRRARL